MSTFQTIQAEPSRDRWGRPLIVPPGGGKPTAYTRCTTYIDVLEDKYNLQKWMQRMVAVGISTRSDLHVAAASLAADPEAHKKQLDEVCEQAVEAAKGTAKATVGTALHGFIERINLGQDPGHVPADFQPHIDAYKTKTTMLHPVLVERFVVQDDLQVGGTPDIVASIDGEEGHFICDLKTGPSTLKYGALKVAMQMSVYAHSKLYDASSGQRAEMNLRTDKGLVIALDSETAHCSLHWVDLAAGWEAVQVATQVRHWRKRKDLITDYVAPQPVPMPAARPASPVDAPHDAHTQAALMAAIAESPSRDSLLDLWGRSTHLWTDAHTQAAKARLQALAA